MVKTTKIRVITPAKVKSKGKKSKRTVKTLKNVTKKKAPRIRVKPAKKLKKSKINRMLPLFKALHRMNKNKRTVLLQFLDENACESIYECISNIIASPHLSSKKKLRLKRALLDNKDVLRYLSKKTASVKKKKQMLPKIGGSPLDTILAIAIPLLTALL